MARKESPTIVQEELYPPALKYPGEEYPGEGSARHNSPPHDHRREDHRSEDHRREDLDDARLVDLDVDEESPFLRAQKRVSARRGSLPKRAANSLLWAAVAVAILCAFALGAAGLYQYGEHSWRFRLESSDSIEVTGTQNTTRSQIMEVMGADIGRNIFFVPLAQQKAQLEQIPWVESASVMRFVPNRLKVEIHERTPVAFARVGPRIALIDAGGTLMELPRSHKYSFPVILGMNPGEPLSTRAPRMKAYDELVRDLDSGGVHYSQDLSEVDLSDLDDLKVRVNNPAGDVLLHLGSSDYMKRYKIYLTHVQEWRQQFQKLESVNLRYDNQVIVNPDMEGAPKQAQLTLAAAKAAAAAGVKPTALISRIVPTHIAPTHLVANDRSVPKPVFELSQAKLDPKAAAKKPAIKTKTRKPRTGKALAAKRAVIKAPFPPRSAVTQPAAQKQTQSASAGEKPATPKPNIAKPSPAVAKVPANTSSN